MRFPLLFAAHDNFLSPFIETDVPFRERKPKTDKVHRVGIESSVIRSFHDSAK